MSIVDREFYTSPRTFLFSNTGLIIHEYDIASANANVMWQDKLIDTELYEFLLRIPKDQRVRIIGEMMRDKPELVGAYSDSLRVYRNKFCEMNGINVTDDMSTDVLLVMRDAIFTIGKEAHYLDFGAVHFVNKGHYTSYLLFNTKRNKFSVLYNGINKIIEVKGISDKTLKLYNPLLLQFIQYILEMVEGGKKKEEIFMVMNNFYNDYTNFNLDIEFYRELNPECGFRIKPMTTYGTSYLVPSVDQDPYSNWKKGIDITRNAEVLSCLWTILTAYYKM